MTTGKPAIWAVIALIAVQVVDTAVHVATSQVEPVRILSNGLLSGWAIWGLTGQVGRRIGFIVIAIYLALNGLFLVMYGVTNPQQGDALRVPLFVLVGLSTGLAVWVNSRKS
ncbi:MAG: hypothetical protein AAFY85_10140 [Pseudomonadota bacterium]